MKYNTIFSVNFLVTTILVVFFVVFERQAHLAQLQLNDATLDLYAYKSDIKDLYRLLVDRETGQRGYIITHDEAFLEPYYASGRELSQLVEKIRPSLDTTSYTMLVDLISKRAEYFQQSFDMLEQQRSVSSFIAEGRGKYYMDAMREILDGVIEQKEHVLSALKTQHRQALERESLITLIFLLFIVASNLIFLLISVYKISKPQQRIINFLQAFTEDKHVPMQISSPGIVETDQLLQHLTTMTTVVREHADALEHTIEALENEKRHKDVFLSNMSHELRTPLNGIYGALQIIKGGNDSERELLSAAKECTQSLSEIISTILDSQKMSAGQFTLDNAWHPCEPTLQSVTKLHQAAASLKSIEFYVTLRHLPDEIYCDKTRLGQILNNVIGNAVKFTEQGGIRITIGYEDGQLNIIVADTGIGMNETAIKHLFERFTQADSSISRRFQGTGLGMAITKQLVDLMNGTIDVKSAPGEGTEFAISLPMHARGTSQTQTEVPLDTRGYDSRLRILLVDDIATNLTVVKMALEEHFSQIDIAYDGLEAWEKIANHSYDIVITDISMPKMNGVELLSTLRQHGHKIPVIALTGIASYTDIQHYIASGFAAVLTKPLDVEKLLKAVLNFST